jgi:LPS-assembly protein
VTTRLLTPTAAPRRRFGIAQRLRFSDQRVTMPGALPVSERVSDVLLGAGINWTPHWGLTPPCSTTPRPQLAAHHGGARYSPGSSAP